jgi:hypothetical protein
VVGERQEPRGDVTVLTKVVGGEYDGSLVDYRMRSKNGGPWLVIDVIVEGVSLVSNYRDQFKEVLSNGGPEELLRRLKEKNAAGISDQVQGSRPGQGPDHPTSLASREGSPRGGSLHIGPYDLRPTGTDAASLRSVCG